MQNSIVALFFILSFFFLPLISAYEYCDVGSCITGSKYYNETFQICDGCPGFLWGPCCENQYSISDLRNCETSATDQLTGHCESCNEHYSGPLCQTFNCQSYLPGCIESCDIASCVNGLKYYNETFHMCDGCYYGGWGVCCENQHSQWDLRNCVDENYNQTTGQCYACNAGYTGPLCQELDCGYHIPTCIECIDVYNCSQCQVGSYLSNYGGCLTCPAGCDYRGCFRLDGFSDGICYNCSDGLTGPYCNIQCPSECLNCNQNMQCTSCRFENQTGPNCNECLGNCHTCEVNNLNACTYCKNGYFGAACSNICSNNCSVCDNSIFSDGCSSCKDGLWGVALNYYQRSNCEYLCSENVEICNATTGDPIKCELGFRDVQNLCNVTCPVICTNCSDTGTCLSCNNPLFVGDSCELECALYCGGLGCRYERYENNEPALICDQCTNGTVLHSGGCVSCPSFCSSEGCFSDPGFPITCFNCNNQSFGGDTCNIPCNPICKTCNTRSQDGLFCTSCHDDQHFGINCAPCASPCSTCGSNVDDCTSCLPNYYNPGCLFPCSNYCDGCYNNITGPDAGKCIGCVPGRFGTSFGCNYNCPTNSVCNEVTGLIEYCVDGYTESLSNNACVLCPIGCKKCRANYTINSERCEECSPRYYRYFVDGECLRCPRDCECDNNGHCYNCTDNTKTGLFCELQCPSSCDNSNSCIFNGYNSNGQADIECKACVNSKAFGKQCEYQCPESCPPEKCSNGITGNGCLYCEEQFINRTSIPASCTECPPFHFGKNCEPCRIGCNQSCYDGVSGDGYCESCNNKWWGGLNFYGTPETGFIPYHKLTCDTLCDSKCSTCDELNGYCITCPNKPVDERFLIPNPGNCNNMGCYTNCSDGFFGCLCANNCPNTNCKTCGIRFRYYFDLFNQNSLTDTEREYLSENWRDCFQKTLYIGQESFYPYFAINTDASISACEDAVDFTSTYSLDGPLTMHLCDTCHPGQYGPRCEFNCSSNCANNTCSDGITGTGQCVCKTGVWGDKCEKTCNSLCNSTCNKITGYCDSCSSPLTSYGPYCKSCPSNCLSCSYGINGNGKCMLCENGYYGDFCRSCPVNCTSCNKRGQCTDCKENNYGTKCENRCSSSCFNGECYVYSNSTVKSGSCKSCQTGKTGQLCECESECPIGKYGCLCESICSSQCGIVSNSSRIINNTTQINCISGDVQWVGVSGFKFTFFTSNFNQTAILNLTEIGSTVTVYLSNSTDQIVLSQCSKVNIIQYDYSIVNNCSGKYEDKGICLSCSDNNLNCTQTSNNNTSLCRHCADDSCSTLSIEPLLEYPTQCEYITNGTAVCDESTGQCSRCPGGYSGIPPNCVLNIEYTSLISITQEWDDDLEFCFNLYKNNEFQFNLDYKCKTLKRCIESDFLACSADQISCFQRQDPMDNFECKFYNPFCIIPMGYPLPSLCNQENFGETVTWCSSSCEPGYYGCFCQYKCSGYCGLKSDGTINCYDGPSGDGSCLSCAQGFFGQNCTNYCAYCSDSNKLCITNEIYDNLLISNEFNSNIYDIQYTIQGNQQSSLFDHNSFWSSFNGYCESESEYTKTCSDGLLGDGSCSQCAILNEDSPYDGFRLIKVIESNEMKCKLPCLEDCSLIKNSYCMMVDIEDYLRDGVESKCSCSESLQFINSQRSSCVSVSCGIDGKCNNNGECTLVGNDNFCKCYSGWTGIHCSEPVIIKEDCDCGVVWESIDVDNPFDLPVIFNASLNNAYYTATIPKDLQGVNLLGSIPILVKTIQAGRYIISQDFEVDGFIAMKSSGSQTYSLVPFNIKGNSASTTTSLMTLEDFDFPTVSVSYQINWIERVKYNNCSSFQLNYNQYTPYSSDIIQSFCNEKSTNTLTCDITFTYPSFEYWLSRHWRYVGHLSRDQFSPNNNCHMGPSVWNPAFNCNQKKPRCPTLLDKGPGCAIRNQMLGYCTKTPIDTYECQCKTFFSENSLDPDFTLNYKPAFTGSACQYSVADYCINTFQNTSNRVLCNGNSNSCKPNIQFQTRFDYQNLQEIANAVQLDNNYRPRCDCSNSPFTGDYCQTSKCGDGSTPECSGRGVCLLASDQTNYRCQCTNNTVIGDNCEADGSGCLVSARFNVKCSGSGTCMPRNALHNTSWCICNTGYIGQNCEQTTCFLQGRGVCDSLGGKDYCYPVFDGTTCQNFKCEVVCSSPGCAQGFPSDDLSVCRCPAPLAPYKDGRFVIGCWPQCPVDSVGNICGDISSADIGQGRSHSCSQIEDTNTHLRTASCECAIGYTRNTTTGLCDRYCLNGYLPTPQSSVCECNPYDGFDINGSPRCGHPTCNQYGVVDQSKSTRTPVSISCRCIPPFTNSSRCLQNSCSSRGSLLQISSNSFQCSCRDPWTSTNNLKVDCDRTRCLYGLNPFWLINSPVNQACICPTKTFTAVSDCQANSTCNYCGSTQCLNGGVAVKDPFQPSNPLAFMCKCTLPFVNGNAGNCESNLCNPSNTYQPINTTNCNCKPSWGGKYCNETFCLNGGNYITQNSACFCSFPYYGTRCQYSVILITILVGNSSSSSTGIGSSASSYSLTSFPFNQTSPTQSQSSSDLSPTDKLIIAFSTIGGFVLFSLLARWYYLSRNGMTGTVEERMKLV